MLLLLPAWLIMAVICLAHGSVVWGVLARCGPSQLRLRPRLGQVFWLGFALCTAELQVVSLFRRTDHVTLEVLLGLSLLGVRPAVALLPRRRPVPTGRAMVRALGVVVLTLLVAHVSTLDLDWYDTQSTHLQQVKWAAAYRALPGLGNVNGKLAFDQAHHLWAAVVARGPLARCTAHVIVGFLVWATSLQWLFVLSARAHDPSAVRSKIFAGLTLAFLAGKIMSGEVPSLSGDLAMACVLLAGMLELQRTPSEPGRVGERRRAWALVAAAALGGTLFAIKWSALPFSVLSWGLLVWWLRRAGARRAWIAASVPLLLIAATLLRRIVLTGWVFYPIPFVHLPLSFTVPEDSVVSEYTWIKSWARMPGGDPADVLGHGFFRWFVPWYAQFRGSRELVLLASALAALAVTGSRTLVAGARRGSSLPIVVSLALVTYWFVGAPDLRFGSCFVWLLFASAFVPHFAAMYASASARTLLLLSVLWLVNWNNGFAVPFPVAPRWDTVPPDPLSPTRVVTIDKDRPIPLRVNVPNQDMCGVAPLPCSFRPDAFRPRVPGSMSKGFVPKE